MKTSETQRPTREPISDHPPPSPLSSYTPKLVPPTYQILDHDFNLFLSHIHIFCRSFQSDFVFSFSEFDVNLETQGKETSKNFPRHKTGQCCQSGLHHQSLPLRVHMVSEVGKLQFWPHHSVQSIKFWCCLGVCKGFGEVPHLIFLQIPSNSPERSLIEVSISKSPTTSILQIVTHKVSFEGLNP